MTSPNGYPAILYCGFNNKNSWLACPYMHNELRPTTKISEPFLIIINIKPIAKFVIDSYSYTAQGNLLPGTPIYFNGSDSYDPNNDELIEYVWEFNIGPGKILKYGREVQHVYDKPGVHHVNLKVFDGKLWSDNYYLDFEITILRDLKYLSYIAYPLSVYTNEPVFFVCNLSTMPEIDRYNIKYNWYFGDGQNEVTTINHTIHKYQLPGQYRITLYVEDTNGQSLNSSNILITVKNRLPKAIFQPISAKPVGWRTMVSAENSFDTDGKIITYIWDFGDCSKELRTNRSRLEHTWNQSGFYSVHLTVQDDQGDTDETILTVVIKDNIEKDTDLRSVITISVIILFNLIAIPTMIKLIALLRTHNNERKNKKIGKRWGE